MQQIVLKVWIIISPIFASQKKKPKLPMEKLPGISQILLPPAPQNVFIPLNKKTAQLMKAGKVLWDGPTHTATVDALIVNHPNVLDPDGDDDGDGLLNKEEIGTIYKGEHDPITGEEIHYYRYRSHPLLADTDGDGIKDKEDPHPLSWDVSLRDAIIGMELSYRNADYIKKVLDNDTVFLNFDWHLNRPEYGVFNKEWAPYWTVAKTWDDPNGFDATLFQFSNKTLPFLENASAHIMAIRGTGGDGGSDGDVANDVRLGIGQWPWQADTAVEVADEINAAGYKNVTVTGHSLGGFLTQIFTVRSIGARYGYPYLNSQGQNWMKSDPNKKDNRNIKQAFTFNAPRIKHGAFAYWMWEYGDLGDYITRNFGTKHYVTANDNVANLVGAFDGAHWLAASEGGHSSRSFMENRYIDLEGVSVGARRGFTQGTGYIDPLLANGKPVMIKPTRLFFKSEDGKVLKMIILAKKQYELRVQDIAEEYKHEFAGYISAPALKEGQDNTWIVKPKEYRITYRFKDGNDLVSSSAITVKRNDDSYSLPEIPSSNNIDYKYCLSNELPRIDLASIDRDQEIDIALQRVAIVNELNIDFVTATGEKVGKYTGKLKPSELRDFVLKQELAPKGYQIIDLKQKLVADKVNQVLVEPIAVVETLPNVGGRSLIYFSILGLALVGVALRKQFRTQYRE